MKNKKQQGLSLIEVIFSMWIIAVVIFSTVVCTSGMNAKFNQRKLQALNIAKSELERIKYLASLGSLELNGVDTPKNKKAGTRDYTLIRFLTDDQDVELLDQKITFEGEPEPKYETDLLERFSRVGDKEDLIFDSVGDNLVGTANLSAVNKFKAAINFKPGNLIAYVRQSNKRKVLREQLAQIVIQPKELENSDDIDKESGKETKTEESKGKKGFVVDVNIKFSEESKKTAADDKSYLYEVRVSVGWMEKSNGADRMASQTYYSRVLSNVTPYFENKNVGSVI